MSGLAGAEPLRSAALQALSDAAAAGEVVRRDPGARRAQAGPASVPAPMAINSQPYRGRPPCVHCGFCHGFGCEVMAKASTLTTVIPEAEATGRCEVRPDSYVSRIETNAAGTRDRRRLLRSPSARAFPAGTCGRRVRERRRDAAAAAHVGEPAVSAGSGELERPRRQVPHVQLHGARARRLRARAERIQERAGDAHRARLLRFGSEARLLWRRRPRRAHRPAADVLGDSHSHGGSVLGQRLQGSFAGIPAQHADRLSRHVAGARSRTTSRSIRS